jgi:transposase
MLPGALSTRSEKLILDFGDIFFLDTYLQMNGLKPSIDAIGYGNLDTLYSMLSYYILCSAANCHAEIWWEGSYARILYPKANLTSQRVSDFLAAIGDEKSQRDFFGAYIPYLTKKHTKGTNILIDSTGLANNIHFPLTAISNHNGEINNEVRLIYVTQQETGLPIYFRYCPGNVIDVTTLIRTMLELKKNGVDTKFAILDAGYYDNENMTALYEYKISFVTRLKENLTLYKTLMSEHLPTIESEENFVNYNSRYAYVKCVECEPIKGNRAYAYIGLDIDRKGNESRKLFQSAKEQKLRDKDVYAKMTRQGVFILISSRRIAKDKILPTYYIRQQIEQIFDIGKNYAEMLPLRVQNEDTFRGHLLMTFIASVILKKIQDALSNSKYNPISLFMNLRNQKCKVYDDLIITQEPVRKVNECYKLFKITCPIDIPRT